ncbi:MAG: class I SAM-dependent methyltransferase [Actinobacteria bacterium]|nr:class I SAM-dependent methyltransferase [Actinomycetota bacterium]
MTALRGGRITLTDPLGHRSFGDDRGPAGRVHVHDLRAYDRLISGGGAGLGASYADGLWSTDDLTAVLRVALRNTRRTHPLGNAWHALLAPVTDRIARARRRQSLEADAADIRAHYDLGNDFFELVLDETMMYSAAYFADGGDDLAAASRAKLDLLNRLLDLQDGDRVLEIGTGWGGYAEHTARNVPVSITTTTISREQYLFAQQRMRQAGLNHQVQVLDQDYRMLQGEFDKAVSIEMIEAVDWREYDTYFAAIAQRLRPGGRFAMQAIVIGDADFDRAKRKSDFIKEYIFPGGCLPSVRALRAAAANHGLVLTAGNDLGLHYAETLRRWRTNLHAAAANHPEVAPLSDERFVRLWDFYFSYCEAGFTEGYITDKQLLFERR